MRCLVKRMLRGLLLVGTVLIGIACNSPFPFGYGEAAYGAPVPPSHPTVVLTDFSYTPASPIRIGDTLTFTARTNVPTTQAEVFANLPTEVSSSVTLRDDGKFPDETAGDGIWMAQTGWTAEMGPVEDGWIYMILGFEGDYANQTLTELLTVLEAEGGEQ